MSSIRMQRRSRDVADDVHDLGDAGALAPLVDDGEIAAQALGDQRARKTPPMSGETISRSPELKRRWMSLVNSGAE